MNEENLWNGIDRRHQKYSERSPSHYHFAYHKSHVNLPGIEHGSLDERTASNHLESYPDHVLRHTSASLCILNTRSLIKYGDIGK